MAQLFAGRTDLLAPAYARALTTLTDQVPQVPLAEIERVIREEYGAPPAELFERFDEVPIAAASLGQVHRARHAGEEVVIKVLRPGVEALVAEDVRVSQRIVALVRALVAEPARRRHARRDPGVRGARRARRWTSGRRRRTPWRSAPTSPARARDLDPARRRADGPPARARAGVLPGPSRRPARRMGRRGTRAARPPRARGDGAVRAG